MGPSSPFFFFFLDCAYLSTQEICGHEKNKVWFTINASCCSRLYATNVYYIISILSLIWIPIIQWPPLQTCQRYSKDRLFYENIYLHKLITIPQTSQPISLQLLLGLLPIF